MPNISSFQKNIEQSLAHIKDCLNYETKKVSEQEIHLRFENSVVKYILDLHYYDLTVTILLEKDTYDCLLLMELLAPEYLDQMQQYQELAEIERMNKYIDLYGVFISNHCEALLKGAGDLKIPYAEFYEESRKLQAAVLQLSFSDPIRKKFFSGDRSWKKDLKSKMN